LAKVLIGWELGAGGGHSSRLLSLGRVLAARGHTPLFAAQQIGPFAAHGPTWQAPVWPRLLGPLSRRYAAAPATMGDMLAYLGLDDVEAMAAMIMAWARIIADANPEVVVAEYAPMLQLAARGRVPCLAWGTGFSLPPGKLASFPSFNGEAAAVPEQALLDGLNLALRRAGRGPLSALPEMFAADRSLISTFSELDPYRRWRRGALGPPALSGSIPLATGEGEELFVYLNTPANRPEGLVRGLIEARLPTRIHDPLIDVGIQAALEAKGIRVERDPVPFAEIAPKSRLVLSHGGLGLSSSALLAGLPQIIVPFDQEKRLTAGALAELGVSRTVNPENIEPGAFAGMLSSAWNSVAMRERTREIAPQFRTRMTPTAEEAAADLVEELL
jgi:rhamnosyltransferase subunit B